MQADCFKMNLKLFIVLHCKMALRSIIVFSCTMPSNNKLESIITDSIDVGIALWLATNAKAADCLISTVTESSVVLFSYVSVCYSDFCSFSFQIFCFHGRTTKNIRSLQHNVRRVHFMKLSSNIEGRQIVVYFEKNQFMVSYKYITL